MTLVDLGGPELPSSSGEKREGVKTANQSLLTFTRVIQALARQESRVPYRCVWLAFLGSTVGVCLLALGVSAVHVRRTLLAAWLGIVGLSEPPFLYCQHARLLCLLDHLDVCMTPVTRS